MRCWIHVVSVFAACATGTAQAAERAYPVKPIRLISAYAPGGGNDAMARALAHKLTDAWGQQVIVDNRPGANGLLAREITDFAPISLLGRTANALVVHPSTPARTLKELVAYKIRACEVGEGGQGIGRPGRLDVGEAARF